MTRRRARLDHSRSFGVVYGGGPARYEQDDKRFDHQGLEILPDRGTDHTAGDKFGGENPHANERPRSPAAERMHRTRKRRRAGIIIVRNIEITKKHIGVLVARNFLSPAELCDQDKLATAVLRALDEWIGSPRRKTP